MYKLLLVFLILLLLTNTSFASSNLEDTIRDKLLEMFQNKTKQHSKSRSYNRIEWYFWYQSVDNTKWKKVFLPERVTNLLESDRRKQHQIMSSIDQDTYHATAQQALSWIKEKGYLNEGNKLLFLSQNPEQSACENHIVCSPRAKDVPKPSFPPTCEEDLQKYLDYLYSNQS